MASPTKSEHFARLLAIVRESDPGFSNPRVLFEFVESSVDHIPPGSSEEDVCNMLALLASMRMV